MANKTWIYASLGFVGGIAMYIGVQKAQLKVEKAKAKIQSVALKISGGMIVGLSLYIYGSQKWARFNNNPV